MNEENKPIKIAFLTTRDPHDRRSWSGLIYYIAQSLEKHCGEVIYFGPIPRFRPDVLFGKIIYKVSCFLLKKKYSYCLLLAKSNAKICAHWLAEQTFDVIVSPDGATEIAFLETDIPILLIGDSTHGSLLDYYPEYSHFMKKSVYQIHAVQRLALKNADRIVYASAWAAQSAIENYSTHRDKVHVVPFGANLEESPPLELALARKKSEQCRLLFLGVDWQRKGGDIAFETLVKLEELGIQAELVVCGCTPPKGLSHEHMKVISFLDKNDERQRKELETLLLLADFLLVPTRAEAYGLVFCEASAFGLPVITTNTGGVPEIVRDGENGFLLPYEARGEVYADTIAKIYRDDQQYSELVKSSRVAYDTRLNWDVWGLAVKQILAEMLHHEMIHAVSVIVSKAGK
ncbi:MAG: glycosyltransferase family 4 protein [Ktedonobacteraceae bacterium]